MVTHGLLRCVEVRRDLTGGQLAGPHQPEDLTAVRVGERPKDDVRGVTLIGCTGRRTAPGCAHDDKDLIPRSPTRGAAPLPRGG